MSNEALTYVKLLELGPLERPALRLLLYIVAENTFNDSFRCKVGQKLLGYEAGRVSERTVRRLLGKLDKNEITKCHGGRNVGGARKNDEIELCGYEGWYKRLRAEQQGKRKKRGRGGGPEGSEAGTMPDSLSGMGMEGIPDNLTGTNRTDCPARTGQNGRYQPDSSCPVHTGHLVSGYNKIPLQESVQDSPPPPQRGVRADARREREINSRQEEWVAPLRQEAATRHVVQTLLEPLLLEMPLQHKNPAAMLKGLAHELRNESDAVLAETLRELRTTRKKIVSAKCVLDALKPARMRVPLVTIKPSDPSWEAWCGYYRRQGRMWWVSRAESDGGFRETAAWPPGFGVPPAQRHPTGG